MGLAACTGPIALLLIVRANVLGGLLRLHIPFRDNPLIGATFWNARLTAVKIMFLYLGKLLVPANLSCDYSFHQISVARGAATDYLPIAGALIITGGLVYLYRWNRRAVFPAAFAFVVWFPVSNLAIPIGAIMAERFAYLPSAGLIAGVALGACFLAERARVSKHAAIIAVIVVAALACRTLARNADWHDDLSLARSAVLASPGSYKSHEMLALALLNTNSQGATLAEAIAESRQSTQILDALPDSQNDSEAYHLAGALDLLEADSGRDTRDAYVHALAALQRCAAILQATGAATASSPSHDVYRMLSLAYLRLGDSANASRMAGRARASSPLDPLVYRQMSSVFVAEGRADDAAVALVTGSLLTGDTALRDELLRMYREGLDKQGCATVQGPYGAAINPACAIVRRHICAAAPGALEAATAAHRPDLYETLRQGFADTHCAADARQ
jgi:hypothetical protein